MNLQPKTIKKIYILTILLVGILLACSKSDEGGQTFGYTADTGELYCVAISESRVDVAEILEGGECGEKFLKQGDLYEPMGSGGSFPLPAQTPDCKLQIANKYFADGPIFLFIIHSLGEEGIELLKQEKPEINRRHLKTDSTCSIDYWILSEANEDDVYAISLEGRTIPIIIGDITSKGAGGVSTPSTVTDRYRIGH